MSDSEATDIYSLTFCLKFQTSRLEMRAAEEVQECVLSAAEGKEYQEANGSGTAQVVRSSWPGFILSSE